MGCYCHAQVGTKVPGKRAEEKGAEPKHARAGWKSKRGENGQSPCNDSRFKERTPCQLIFLQHSNLTYILFKTHWRNSLHSSAGHQPTFLSSPCKKKKDSISATHIYTFIFPCIILAQSDIFHRSVNKTFSICSNVTSCIMHYSKQSYLFLSIPYTSI